MQGQKRLIGRNNIFACGNRGLGRGLGRAIRAAHQFNKDIHILALGQCYGIILPCVFRQIHAAIFVTAAGAYGGNGDLAPCAGFNERAIVLNHLDDTCANGAKTCDCKTQRAFHDPEPPNTYAQGAHS